jgi:hypothetical protein
MGKIKTWLAWGVCFYDNSCWTSNPKEPFRRFHDRFICWWF